MSAISSYTECMRKRIIKFYVRATEYKSAVFHNNQSNLPMNTSSRRLFMGDRFISRRDVTEHSNSLGLLDEIMETEEKLCLEKMQTNETELPQDELNNSKKSYCSLLQNQVLGVNDQYTISQLAGTTHLYKGYPFDQKFSLFRSANASQPGDLNKENAGYHLPPCSGFQEDEHRLLSQIREDRRIARIPFKVLDAPALQDDFYLNVIDWSAQGVLAVGLGTCVYLWSAQGKVVKLSDVGPSDSITSVGWFLNGATLAVGTYSGAVQIWDTNKAKRLRTLKAHDGRVGALAWNSSVLSTGSRDKSIIMNDIKVKSHVVATLQGHKQEVCGLKWSYDEQQLASGGNDNKLFVWNKNTYARPSARFTSHTAAVKALAWSPHQHGLLVSGGGTADRCIRSWNTLNNSMLDCTDTGSQVCSLVFSKTVDELVSSHGYSQNFVFVWKHEGMRKLATLAGHTSRVLYLAASNDSETIVTGAGDETLRFWKVFPKAQTNSRPSLLLVPSGKDLR